MRDWFSIAAFGAVLIAAPQALFAGATPQRNPEIKDEEIKRYVYLKTNCGLNELVRLNPGGQPLRFHIDCKNVSNWPEGMDITCAEPDDDRTCRVTTVEKHFKYLDVLRRKD